MEPISMILTALAAGAVSAAKDTASQAVKDAYAGLKALVQKRFADEPKAQATLTEFEKDSDTWEKPLKKSLIEAGLDKDHGIIEQAQEVLRLINQQQAVQGKYNIQIGEAKGVVIGDDAQVSQTFGQE